MTFHVLRRFLSECDGTSAVEYCILGSAIAAVIAVTVGVLGQAVAGLFARGAAGW